MVKNIGFGGFHLNGKVPVSDDTVYLYPRTTALFPVCRETPEKDGLLGWYRVRERSWKLVI